MRLGAQLNVPVFLRSQVRAILANIQLDAVTPPPETVAPNVQLVIVFTYCGENAGCTPIFEEDTDPQPETTTGAISYCIKSRH